MKRALAIAVALCTLGVAAFGLGTISGKWEAKINLLPTVSLASHKLTVNYTDYGWTFTGILSGAPFSTFQGVVKGVFGPFNLTGNAYFDFSPADYNKADVTTGFDFGGVALSLKIEHWSADETGVPCPVQTGDLGYLRYTLTGTVAPLTLKVIMLDCCTGAAFNSLTATLKGLELCCGIKLDAELYFTKAGFQYLQFSGINIPLGCCGISFDVGVRFTTTTKSLTFEPKFGGFGEGCFTVYGNALFSGYTWQGVEIYGWKIRCTIADCNWIEFLTAYNVSAVEAIVGDVFAGNEFEYIKMNFCGAGCCGGKYNLALSVYFDNGGGLFGISRLGATAEIPLMANFSLTFSFATPNTLSIGWVFTF